MSDRKARLQRLAASRKNATKSRAGLSDDEGAQLYDIVDEDQYRRELEDDDFVEVNDGDHGYTYDDGTNDLGDTKHNYYSDDDQAELALSGREKSKKRKTKHDPVQEVKKSTNRSIKTFLTSVKKEEPVSIGLKD